MSSSSENDQSPKLLTFRILWAFALVFHQVSSASFPIALKQGIWPSILIDLLVDIACCLVIYAPKNSKWFLLLLSGAIIKLVYELPLVSNHLQLIGLISGALLVSQIKANKTPIDSLKLTTIVIYLLVTLHKLNWGFFSQPGSCAYYYGDEVLGGFLPVIAVKPILNLLPGIVVLGEGAIALLLFSKDLNYLGVILGFLLHFFLGLDLERRFFNFSALMFALLFLFSSGRSLDRLVNTLGEERFCKHILRTLQSPNLRVLFALILFAFQFGLSPDLETANRVFSFRVIITLWFLLSLLLTTLAVIFGRESDTPISRRNMSVLVLPLAILIIGLGPYLGFRTRLSLDMYSNLETEDGRSNHFFLPSLDLWGTLSDTVTIEKSSDPLLVQEFANKNLRLVGIEFDRYLESHPNEEVTYIRNNEKLTSTGQIQPLHSKLIYKFTTFRPVNASGEPLCQW